MDADKLKDGLDALVENSNLKLKDNLKAIFMFGSGNHLEDFIPNLSDLDFLYILGSINYDSLQNIKSIRNDASNKLKIKIDIKPFSLDEYINGIQGKSSFEFFTGWGLEMIKRGEQKCIYNTGEVPLDYEVDSNRLKKDSLERAHYYITKLRKIFSTDEARILRGTYTILNEQDNLKMVSSSIKNVLAVCLAYKGIIANRYYNVLEKSEDVFGDIEEFSNLFQAKKELRYNLKLIIAAYNKIEQIYQGVINE